MEYRHVHRFDWKADDVHRRQRSPTHGVDIRKRICSGNQAEGIGIVNNGRKKIERLNKGKVIRQFINPCIIAVLDAGDQVWIGYERQTAQRSVQVPRTDFTGSPRTADGLGEANILFILHTVSFHYNIF